MEHSEKVSLKGREKNQINSCEKVRVIVFRKAEFKTCAEELNADLSLVKTLEKI